MIGRSFRHLATRKQNKQMMWAKRCTALAVFLLLASAATPALAQSTEPNFEQFQWNFSNPGARARGMGGSFIGVADDATAAIANPAGLLALTKPQVYFEFKSVSTDSKRFAATDSFLTRTTTTFHNRSNFPSFVSVAFPVGDRLAVSFARHQFLYFVDHFAYAPRLSHAGTTLSPLTGASDFRAASYAGSIAVALGKKVRLGVTVALNRLTAHANTTTFKFVTTPAGPVATGDVESVASFGPSADSGGASSASFTMGLLYRPNTTATLGFFYAKTPRFKMQLAVTDAAGAPVEAPTDLFINVPTRLGFGGSIRKGRVLIAGDFVVILYEQLLKDFVVQSSLLSKGLKSSNYRIGDGGELRFGAEITLKRGRTQVFGRCGLNLRDDARLHFEQAFNTALTPTVISEEEDKLNLIKKDSEPGDTTAGIGVVFARRAQFDFAVTSNRELTASFMVRF